jgi:hypothetical protein
LLYPLSYEGLTAADGATRLAMVSCSVRSLVRGDRDVPTVEEHAGVMANSWADLPPDYADTRDKLHLVAARVLGAARYLATGRFGLRVVEGGFGTPEFDGRSVAVVEGQLADGDRRQRLTTLGDACEFAGVDLSAPLHAALELAAGADTDVAVDPAAARIMADWYALSQGALEALAAACGPADDVTEIQLWPEHFDVALSAGSEASRANYGGSPGDAAIGEPYLYVGPFEPRSGEFWNASFGAVLTYSDVRAGADPLAFFLDGRARLSDEIS